MAIELDLKSVASKLAAAKRVVVTTHARADADAIGSAAALARVLRQRGAHATAWLHEPAPPPYAFMVEGEGVAVWSDTRDGPICDAGRLALNNADLIVIVDTCARSQLGVVVEAIAASKAAKLAIDHHKTRDEIVDAWLIDVSAGACAQILTQIFDAASWAIDPTTAMLLFCGLTTDTGWFRFSNADAGAFATAARLIECGVKPNELYERLFLNESIPRARLIGAVMSSFRTEADGRLAVIRVTKEMLVACGATSAMTENLINEPQRVGRIMAAVMLVEPESPGPIRISMRSKHDVDVAAIAAKWGGGGHARAAGVRIDGRIEDVERQLVAAMVEEIERLGA